MKIYNKITTVLTILVFSYCFHGCDEEFLEVEAKSGVFENTLFNSYSNANLFLTNLYNRIDVDNFVGAGFYLPAISDDLMETFEHQPPETWFRTKSFGAVDNRFLDVWSDSYTAIRQCNLLIEKMADAPAISDEEKNLLIGQAKFLRGHFYFEMSKWWGGVPLIDKVLNRDSGEDLEYARSTYVQTIEFVRKDMTEAAAILPNTWPNERGRATKGAALALRSEAELYSSMWAECVATTQEIMDMGIYSIAPEYAPIFLPEGEDNSEVIFDIPFDGANKAHAFEVFYSPRYDNTAKAPIGWGYALPTQNLIDAYEFIDGSPGNDPVRANDPYVGRDKRFYASIIYNRSEWRGGPIITEVDPSNSSAPSNYFDGQNGTLEHQGTLTGYYMKKTLDESLLPSENSTGNPINGTNIIFTRYAEILLNFAEAKNELSGPSDDIYDAINELRARGGVPLLSGLDQVTLREKIRNERRVELAFEGKRYWDLLRWKTAVSTFSEPLGAMKIENNNNVFTYTRQPAYRGKRTFDEKHYLLPIPQVVIDRNSKITQNPGW